MEKPKIAVFADGIVGEKTLSFLLRNKNIDLVYIVTLRNSNIKNISDRYSFVQGNLFFADSLYKENILERLKKVDLEYILLAWWPFIIKQPILSFPKLGILNFHPSLLPYNRGKHYNFWNLVEDVPFGVSIHFITDEIDDGDIVYQRRIQKNWEDTGQTLYEKAQEAILELFMTNCSNLFSNNYKRYPQDKSKGSFHYARELDLASEILVNKKYLIKDILNLIRARTFEPFPSCYFFYKGCKYFIKSNIKNTKKIENRMMNNIRSISLNEIYSFVDLIDIGRGINESVEFQFSEKKERYFVRLIINKENENE